VRLRTTDCQLELRKSRMPAPMLCQHRTR
jgi:hypothetical protein